MDYSILPISSLLMVEPMNYFVTNEGQWNWRKIDDHFSFSASLYLASIPPLAPLLEGG